MSQIIASTYEIIGEIGSGGGGVVYLAQHLRLGKKVVLKADKRKLSTKPETLRREVDALKNMSHTYIPQVYDYIEENSVVYTVMDYVEGESLDKPLKRGEKFSQQQVIEWACELLDALIYMHSIPPHGILHADIKPANIMLTPKGDIRLIDFNIALALGEEGAIAVGRSIGYASPEHYSVDGLSEKTTPQDPDWVLTQYTIPAPTETVIEPHSKPSAPKPSPSSSGTSGKKQVLLDVRSDIYGLGATLYHLLSGKRPDKDANKVEPLSNIGVSSQVSGIVMKAMDPDPEKRYQTAAEMLYALEHLWENDRRVKRLRRKKIAAGIVLTMLFASGAFLAFAGLKQNEQTQKSLALAEYSASALAEGDRVEAVSLALQALPEKTSIFVPPYTAQAQAALADAMGVYELNDTFSAHLTVTLPSETLKLAISPDGKIAAAISAWQTTFFETQTGVIFAEFPVVRSALADVEFVDNSKVAFAGEEGLTLYDLSSRAVLWTGDPATELAVSSDGQTIAAVNKGAVCAQVYDVSGKHRGEVPFGGKSQLVMEDDLFGNPEDNLFALNNDGSMLAVSFSDGTIGLFESGNPDGGIELLDPGDSAHFEGGFSGQFFSFSVTRKDGSSLFAVIDVVNAEQTGGFELTSRIGVETDESGVYISNGTTVVKIDPVTGEQQELAYVDADVLSFALSTEHTFVLTENNEYWMFDKAAQQVFRQSGGNTTDRYIALAGSCAIVGGLDSPTVKVLMLEDHSEAQFFTYDPSYEHDEARVSADGRTVMLFSYSGFRLFDANGGLITDSEIPDAGHVYDQQYKRDETSSRLEVIYSDGRVRTYSAATGELISDTVGEKPDASLYEEFYTDKYKITSPLHGTPEVYDLVSGRKVCDLNSDAYLTYVTQTSGDNIVTEYVTENGERLGLLLDENLNTIANLPSLCDVVGDELYFDYNSGNLRKTRIYSIEELKNLKY